MIAEVAHLVGTRLGARAEVRLVEDFATGTFIAEPVAPSDWQRIAELVWQYRDLGLGTTDASVVAAAERLRLREVATLDLRHFGVVRPRHVESFVLLPTPRRSG